MVALRTSRARLVVAPLSKASFTLLTRVRVRADRSLLANMLERSIESESGASCTHTGESAAQPQRSSATQKESAPGR